MTNPVIESLLSHRSIRKYKPEPVAPDTLDLILRAGIRAATAGNLQLYSLVVIDDPAIKRALEAPECAEAPLAIVALADTYRIQRWFEVNGVRQIENYRPSNLLIAIWDALIALHNIVIAAESLGLGTCYMGDIIARDVQQVLGVPEHVFPAGMVCLGYPNEEPELSSRLPLEGVVHHNRYHLPSEGEIGEYYREKDARWEKVDPEYKRFLLENDVHCTAQAVAWRKFTPAFVDERSLGIMDNIRKAGFVLE